jgi:hypothetical protein
MLILKWCDRLDVVCVQRRSTHPALRAPLRGGDLHADLAIRDLDTVSRLQPGYYFSIA